MAESRIQQNEIPNEPTLNDLFNLFKEELMMAISAHHIGVIQSFDATKQTATATISYQRTFFQLNAQTGVYDPVLVPYPLLVDCPVIALGGGTKALTFPITVGDECLVFFNDRDIDNWFNGASNKGVATPRLHSFSDGLILVGVRSLAKKLAGYDSTRAVLRGNAAGTTGVGVGETLIKIYNPSYTLNGLLQNLLTELQNLTSALAALTVSGVTTGAGVSGVPVNAATITSIGTQIGVTAGQIGALLE